MADLRHALITFNARALDRTRSGASASILDQEVTHGDFRPLDGHAQCLLVTYKRDGSPIAVPVWFARDADGRRLYIWTEHQASKAKRLRRDPRALLAPCTPRGVPLGPPIAARGRVLDTEEERAHAPRRPSAARGVRLRRLFERASRPVMPVAYLEIVPDESQ